MEPDCLRQDSSAVQDDLMIELLPLSVYLQDETAEWSLVVRASVNRFSSKKSALLKDKALRHSGFWLS